MQMWMRTLGIAAPPKPPPTHALAEKILARQKGVAPAPASHSLPIAGSTEAHQGTSLTPGTGGADTEMADAAAALHPSSSGSHSSAESAEAAESAAVKRAMAAAAMAAAKEAASLGASKLYNKVMVTETRKFAGKDLQVCIHQETPVDDDQSL